MLDRNTASPSSAVAMYQRDLIFLGYDLGDFDSVQPSLYPQGADGDFGTMAENATKAFQQDMEIAVTGKGDALTVALAANLARFSEHPRQAGGVMKPITSGSGVSEAKVGELISAHAKAKASSTVHPHSHDEGATGQPQ